MSIAFRRDERSVEAFVPGEPAMRLIWRGARWQGARAHNPEVHDVLRALRDSITALESLIDAEAAIARSRPEYAAEAEQQIAHARQAISRTTVRIEQIEQRDASN